MTYKYKIMHTACHVIPVPLEEARFRKLERFIIKAHFLSRVAP